MSAVAVIAIGRNEGDRLIACLDALQGQGARIIYVDSGSTDGSVAAAEARGADVVALDMNQPFTAARARNAGLDRLADDPEVTYVQFIDGDCVIDPGWMAKAVDFLEATPTAAVVSGRLRERFPDATIYNRMADAEWDTPIGEVKSCGGIAMMRRAALDRDGRFDPNLIAGEEPELCVRLRAGGWQIWRIDGDMALHDIAMTRFSQWWKRMRRAGYAFAEGVHMHGAPPERHNVDMTRRALIWGAALPAAAVLGALILSPWCLLLLLLWPLQVLRMIRRGEAPLRAGFLTLGKIPEALGIFEFHWRRLFGRRAGIMEYK